jgi:cold shock CspA family protein
MKLFDDALAEHIARLQGPITAPKASKRNETKMTKGRVTGTVKFFHAHRGFGFCSIDGTADESAFIGTRALIARGIVASALTPGTRLSFRLLDAPKGAAATAIRIEDAENTTSPAACHCGGVDGRHVYGCGLYDVAA